MIIHDVKQGSEEWMKLRAGIPTASEWDALISPLGKIRSGDMPHSYVDRKVAEAWSGGPLPSSTFHDMEQGQILEQEAIPLLEFEYGWKILRPGFITSDDGKIGCSPDGIIEGQNCGVEVKCPRMETHTGYLLRGNWRKDYIAQVQGSLRVCSGDINKWKFVSYRRGFPLLVVDVEPDTDYQDKLAEAITGFLDEFNEAMAKMKELNGDEASF